MKNSRDLDELSYSFIHQQGHLTDYEVHTDELSALVGAVISSWPDDLAEVLPDLERFQELALHANGSIRGRMAVTEEDLEWAKGRLSAYRALPGGTVAHFVLPRGTTPVPELHACRSGSKKALRALVHYEAEGGEVPDVIDKLLNVFANVFFTLTLVVNHGRGVVEPVFESQSYGPRRGQV